MALKNGEQLKKNALNRLSNCWGESAGIFFINFAYSLLIIILWLIGSILLVGFDDFPNSKMSTLSNDKLIQIGIYTFILLAISYILKIPFKFGKCWYLLQRAKDHNVQAGGLFVCYSSAKRFFCTIKIDLALLLRKVLYAVPLISVGVLEAFLWDFIISVYGPIWYTVSAVFIILTVCCLVSVYYICTLKYRLIPYIYAINPDLSPKETFKKGIDMMYGRESYMIDIIASILKLFIPCILIFPMIFIIPYIMIVYSGAVNEIIENHYSDYSDIDKTKKTKSVVARLNQYSRN